MSDRKIAPFLAGAFLTGLAYSALLLLFVLTTFSFSGETLSKKENREAFCFYAVLSVVLVTGTSIKRKIKRGDKFFAYGMIVPLAFAVAGLLIMTFIYINNLCYFRNFDKATWMKADAKPFDMAKTLVKHSVLLTMSPEKMREMLGQPDRSYGDNEKGSFIYETDNSEWELRVIIENSKIVKAFIYEEGLGL